MLARRFLRQPAVLRWHTCTTRPLSSASSQPRTFSLPPTIAQLLSAPSNNDSVAVTGWIKSIRKQKKMAFAVLSDGSESEGIQAVLVRKPNASGEDVMTRLTNGAAVRLTGKLVESPGSGQSQELLIEDAEDVVVLGDCDPKTYPIQKKDLTPEYLRDNVHLRARTDKIASMLRLRHKLQRGIDNWFDTQSFVQVNTPIMTSNDAEGAGETFRIAPLSTQPLATSSPYPVTPPPPEEFFGSSSHLTVSHQLHLEALASSLSRVYTLSPCFRAERSDTSRHLAEFWMLEAEWVLSPSATSSGSGVHEVCDAVESMLKSIVNAVPTSSSSLPSSTFSSSEPWSRLSYTDAIGILQSAAPSTPFEYPPTWGKGLQSEHERYLAEQHVRGPVFVTDYPTSLKPFYMRENPIDSEGRSTVACFDLLVPGVGELVGGSVREERLDVIHRKLVEAGLAEAEEGGGKVGEGVYRWYEDLRRYGGTPHAGFGMGFERLVSWVSGVENVKECVPFPRWAGRLLL